jgi:hypothetical protein
MAEHLSRRGACSKTSGRLGLAKGLVDAVDGAAGALHEQQAQVQVVLQLLARRQPPRHGGQGLQERRYRLAVGRLPVDACLAADHAGSASSPTSFRDGRPLFQERSAPAPRHGPSCPESAPASDSRPVRFGLSTGSASAMQSANTSSIWGKPQSSCLRQVSRRSSVAAWVKRAGPSSGGVNGVNLSWADVLRQTRRQWRGRAWRGCRVVGDRAHQRHAAGIDGSTPPLISVAAYTSRRVEMPSSRPWPLRARLPWRHLTSCAPHRQRDAGFAGHDAGFQLRRRGSQSQSRQSAAWCFA